MLKEYISRWNYIGLKIKVNGVTKLIEFNPKRDGGSYYVTTNEQEMEALESDKQFNNDFTLFRTEGIKTNPSTQETVIPLDVLKDPIKAAEDGVLEEIKVVEDVATIMQAREYLKNIGINFHKLNTPNAILKQAEDNNIEFPNLKIE